MNVIVTWKKLAIGHINGKYNLIPILTNKQMKLSSLENLTQTVFSIHLLNSMRTILLKCSYQKHIGIVLDSTLTVNTHIDQKIKSVIN